MFGISFGDMLIIAAVGLLVFGPDRLPEGARSAARLVKAIRTLAAGAETELKRELGVDSELRLADLNPKTAVRKYVFDALDTRSSSSNDPESTPMSTTASTKGERHVP